jgi:RNA polymerase sigma factor (sigma-70 family)
MYATAESEHIDPSHLEELPDGDLIRMVKAGNDAALGVLLRRHRDALYRFCLHLTRNRDDAEDVCQESMARAITRVGGLQTGSAFRSWLFSIARNLSIDSHRNRKRICPLPDEELAPLPLPLQHESPYDRVETNEEYQTVAQALSKLKKNHQTVLMLREVERLSYADIAARLDLSQAAVETLLFRARKRLREEYTRTGAPVPVVGILGALRSLLARLSAPFSGAPLAAKIAASALLLGGAAVATPHVIPVLHAAGGSGPHTVAMSHISSLPAAVPDFAIRPVVSTSDTSAHRTPSAHLTAAHAAGHHAGSSTAAGRGPAGQHRTSPGITRFHHISGHVPGGTSGSASNGKSGSAGVSASGSSHGSSTTGSGSGASGSGNGAGSATHGIAGGSSHHGRSDGSAPAVAGSSRSKSGSVAAGSSTTSSVHSGATHSGAGSKGSSSGSRSRGNSGGSTSPSGGSGLTGAAGSAAAGAQQTVTSAAGSAQQTASTATNAAQQAAANAATTASSTASKAATSAANTASGAANTAGKTVSGATGTVGKAVGSVPTPTKPPVKSTPTVPPVPPVPVPTVPVPTVPVPKLPKP